MALASAVPAWAQLEIFNGRGPSGSSFQIQPQDQITVVRHTISGCPDYRVTRRVQINGQSVMLESFDVFNAPPSADFEWLLPTGSWLLEPDDVVTIHYKVQKIGGPCGVEDFLFGDVDGVFTRDDVPPADSYGTVLLSPEPRRFEALCA